MRSAREKLKKGLDLDSLKFFDDMARMATGALGSFSEVRHQIKGMVKQRVDQILAETDLVTRAEFDRVEALATRARARTEELEARLDALEGKKKQPAKGKSGKSAAAKKPATKKTTTKKKAAKK
ncbi:MAG: accessory factor UbiK family protein [Alphaproteobacteria bacterium]|nr:accessory factor UbiK family protein [Alphaproteobacteria bacterium]